MSATLNIFVKARDEASTTIKKTQTASQQLGSSLKRLAGYIGVAFATAEVVRFGKESVQAFDDIEKSRQRLQFGLNAIGREHGLDKITSQLRAFSLQTGVSQQDLTDMAGKVTNLGGKFFKTLGSDAPHAIERLTQAVTDAKAAGAKFRETMIPALVNTPDKATGILQRLGVASQHQVDHIKHMVEAGHRQAAVQLEINLLSSKWAGAAAATATWQDKVRARWEDIKIAVGKFLVGAGAAVFGWLQKNTALLKTLATIIGPMIAAWLAYAGALKVVAAVQLVLNAIMDANPFTLIALAIIAVTALIITHWTTVKRVTLQVWHAIENALKSAWHSIVNAAQTAWRVLYRALSFTPLFIVLKVEFAVLKALFKATFATIGTIVRAGAAVWRNVISPAIHGVATVIRTVLGAIKSAWNAVWGTFAGPVESAFRVIVSAVKTGVNVVIHAINGLIHAYNVLPGHADLPTIPTLRRGGVVERTGLAVVHEGERFSGVGPGAVGLGGDTYNFHNNARPWQEEDLLRVMKRAQLLRGARVA